jgi:hypothetical protein
MDHEFEKSDDSVILCKHCEKTFAQHLRQAAIEDGLVEVQIDE